ncbi:MAG: HAD family hydrolase [Candidatus Nanopelagicales bacterium]|nr:HAD family hydrolase [Candidatus Nanopelagicales bacterium]
MLVESAAQAPFNRVLPITAVLFDFHSTLIDQGDAASWLGHALARAPHELGSDQRSALLAFLDRIWENARVIDPESARDRSPVDHERVFHELLVHGPSMDAPLAAALYASLLDSWHAYADAAPTLRALRAAGVRIGVLSNVGVSIRGVLEREGLADLVDAVVLSCEVGAVKPDPAIFTSALDALGSTAAQTLMVGDSGHDDVGGTALGMRTLVLPRTRGDVHGLAVVVGLVDASRALLA